MNSRQFPRIALSTGIGALFAYVVINHYNEGMEEIIKTLAVGTFTYWLGSSNGSYNKDERIKEKE